MHSNDDCFARNDARKFPTHDEKVRHGTRTKATGAEFYRDGEAEVMAGGGG